MDEGGVRQIVGLVFGLCLEGDSVEAVGRSADAVQREAVGLVAPRHQPPLRPHVKLFLQSHRLAVVRGMQPQY